jgi:cytochrome P450
MQAIAEYLPRIRQQVERLADLIANHSSEPVLLNDVMSWFAFDSMGEFMFKSDFGMMKSSAWHPAIVQQRGTLALLAPLSDAI